MTDDNKNYDQENSENEQNSPNENGWNSVSGDSYNYNGESGHSDNSNNTPTGWQYGKNDWSFNSYDDFEKKSETHQESPQSDSNPTNDPGTQNFPPMKPKKSNGARVFVGILCGIIALALISFASYGVWAMLDGTYTQTDISSEQSQPDELPENSIPEQSDTESQQSTVQTDIPIDRTHDGITIVDRPGNETGEVDIPWTVEVSEKVEPTVVGIEIFSSDYETEDSDVLPDSSGSGIIMSADGYIVTNAHVVSGAYKIRVTLSNGKTYAAALVGSDTITDLAVIRIKASGLPFAEFGNSDQMRVGEFVLAIGSPGGMSLQGSVTYGMVSAVNREIRTSNSTLVCIQTDAAINPGNSGGALVNQYGQIIGINSAKIALDGYEGIGFAIASNHAQPVIEQLIKYGRVTGRIQLGITARLLTQTYALQNGVRPGLYITEIKNQDLTDGGVQPGDIITHIDGIEVESFNGVSEQLAKFKAGDKVTLTIYRPATEHTMAQTFDVEIRLIQDTAD